MKKKILFLLIAIVFTFQNVKNSKADFINVGVDYKYERFNYADGVKNNPNRQFATYYAALKIVPIPFFNFFLQASYSQSLFNETKTALVTINDKMSIGTLDLMYKLNLKKLAIMVMGTYQLAMPHAGRSTSSNLYDKVKNDYFHMYGGGVAIEYSIIKFLAVRITGRALLSNSKQLEEGAIHGNVSAGLLFRF